MADNLEKDRKNQDKRYKVLIVVILGILGIMIIQVYKPSFDREDCSKQMTIRQSAEILAK